MFNRKIDWTENMKVVAWVAELSGNFGLRKWHRMQCIKVGSTLRVSPKGDKPSPRVVYREGKQDERARFKRYRNHGTNPKHVKLSYHLVVEFKQ